MMSIGQSSKNLTAATHMDYDSVVSDLTISGDSTSESITVNADTVVEEMEMFNLSLTTIDGSVYIMTPEATVFIEDNTGK